MQQRLLSLDILRGFDLFMLLFFQPVLVALLRELNLPTLNIVLHQFEHESWIGFRAWDLVMPLFLFMVGVAMPFAFSKYREEKSKFAVYKKIIRRVFILFILGMVVQGNLLSFDIHILRLYSNTLQSIAMGYLIASIIILNLSFRWQIAMIFILSLLYWIPMTIGGDYTPEGNFAEKIDKFVLGRFRDGISWDENGDWLFSADYHYTWILSSLTFGVTVLMGAIAGHIVKQGKNRKRSALILFGAGILGVVVGLLWNLEMPIIKKLWTSSMAFYSGGLCFLLFALFYYVIDCLYLYKWITWLNIYGVNSIIAYVVGEVVNFRSIIHSISYGLEQYLQQYYTVWLTFGNFLILFFILYYMNKQKVYIKI